MLDEKNKGFGYLQTCMDKRFVAPQRKVFEEKTGLNSREYWQESYPGGSALATDPLGEDYASQHGATIFGWGAHGSACGGQPGVSDGEIRTRLQATIEKKKKKFPHGTHFSLFSTVDGTEITEV